MRAIARTVVDTVRESGVDGAPESLVHNALQQIGATHSQCCQLIDVLIEAGQLRRRYHRLYAD